MTRVAKRNIEIIRKKNLEDNKIFFEQLLLTSVSKLLKQIIFYS